jgi:sulfate adenylyltransferase subunit 1 (EFTu-like GTPase family)
LTLADEVDVSRGDMIVEAGAPATVTDRIDARIFWMGQNTFAPGARYLIKLGTASAAATVTGPLRLIDLAGETGPVAADRLMPNEFGLCPLQFDRPLALDPYAANRETGSFILIDPESHDTVAMGLVDNGAQDVVQPQRGSAIARSLAHRLARLFGARESHTRSIAKAVSWRATGSFDTFVVSFIITGNTTIAGSIAAAEIATKLVFYYFHERVWALVPWGRR